MRISKVRFNRYFLAIILILALCAVYGFLSDNFHEVVKGRIYRSGQPSPHELEKIIQKNKIKTIINLRGRQKGEKWYEEEKAIARSYGVKVFDIALSAYELPDVLRLDAMIEILQNAERPIIIHCKGGAHRSGLASALALAIELNPPISSLKKQFSWIYLVLPFPKSTGTLFFASYEEWLNSVRKPHSRKNLLSWIKNGYVDSNENIEYYIDTAENIIFEETFTGRHLKATIQLGSEDISIKGWAFEARSKMPLKNLYLSIDGRTAAKVDYRYIRPDVAEYFSLDDEYYHNIKLGWIAKFSSQDLSTGCHDVSLKYVKSKSEQLNIRTDYKLCITD